MVFLLLMLLVTAFLRDATMTARALVHGLRWLTSGMSRTSLQARPQGDRSQEAAGMPHATFLHESHCTRKRPGITASSPQGGVRLLNFGMLSLERDVLWVDVTPLLEAVHDTWREWRACVIGTGARAARGALRDHQSRG